MAISTKQFDEDEKKAIIDDAIDSIANGYSLLRYCTENNLPLTTIRSWLVNDDNSDRYARARDVRAEKIFEEMLTIADTEFTTTKQVMADDKLTVITEDHVQHRKLQVDTRKWILARMAPKKYGDKLDVTTGGDKITPPKHDLTKLTDQELIAYARIQAKIEGDSL
jgi:hypothetical protein